MTGKKRVIVAGGGRYALALIKALDKHGHDVVAIERDTDAAEEIMDEYVASVIEGDASDPETLKQADPESSDALAAMTPDQNDNRVICEEARNLNPGLVTVARAEKESEDDDVDAFLLPHELTAKLAADIVEGKEVRILQDKAGALDILEIEVKEGAPVAGKSLEEIRLPRGSLVISDYTRNKLARGETVLEPGHSYLVAMEHDVADEVLNLLRG